VATEDFVQNIVGLPGVGYEPHARAVQVTDDLPLVNLSNRHLPGFQIRNRTSHSRLERAKKSSSGILSLGLALDSQYHRAL
jgi:hypothetical protein